MILQKGRKNEARDVAICISRKLAGNSGVELGNFFGKVSGDGITVSTIGCQKKSAEIIS